MNQVPGRKGLTMGGSNDSSDEDEYRRWWEETFKEREDLLRERFGQTEPPGYVISFSWSDPALIIPGACCLRFPPNLAEGSEWLYLSHGLTQPLKREPPVRGQWSGCGCEFGVITGERSPWAVTVLYQVMTYVNESQTAIGVGHRVPLALFDRRATGEPIPELGVVQEDEPLPPVGQTRALLFWKYRRQPKPLWTKTGYFDLLIATTITQDEWQMAKDTSSAHLALLLIKAGIGQTSDLGRRSVVSDPGWAAEWEVIRKRSDDEVLKDLEPAHPRIDT